MLDLLSVMASIIPFADLRLERAFDTSDQRRQIRRCERRTY